MTLDLPTKSWHLWSRGDRFTLEVFWPNNLATPIVIDGTSLDEMCAEVRREWGAGLVSSHHRAETPLNKGD